MSTMISVIYHIGCSINTDKDIHWSATAILYSTVTETATFSHHQGQTRVVILFPSLHYLTLLVVTCSSPLLDRQFHYDHYRFYSILQDLVGCIKRCWLFFFFLLLFLILLIHLYIFIQSPVLVRVKIFLFLVPFSSPKEVMVFSSYNGLII